MKASNIVISTAAAISMAGALGLVYAQSTYSDPQTGTPAATSQDSSTMSQDSTGTTGTSSSDSMRVARADRN